MTSAPEPAPVTANRTVRRWGAHTLRIAILVGLISGGAATAVVLARPDSTPAGPAAAQPSADDQVGRIDDAIARLEEALRTGRRAEFLRSWTHDPAARSQARELFHNLSALRADLSLSVVLAHGRTAEVRAEWRLKGTGQDTAAATIAVDLAKTDGQLLVSGVTPTADTHQPIWMLGWLTVRRGTHTLVAATDPATASKAEALLRQARQDVIAVDDRWRSTLVAYVPATQRNFEKLLDARPGQYNNIAGVSSPVDGSATEGSPQMIAINPAIFSTLSTDGRRVLMTHEATHLVTNATTSRAPDWLVEGFADYVAIAAAKIPAQLVAGPALGRLESAALPRQLPTDAAFADRSPQKLQQAYALSWLAVRMLAERYGERRLVSFYEAALAEPERLNRALHIHLSTSLSDVTHQWRLLVRELANAA